VALTTHQHVADIKERTEFYFLSGTSWPILGRTLPYVLPTAVFGIRFCFMYVYTQGEKNSTGSARTCDHLLAPVMVS
jgi:hypothetical protein